MHIGKLVFSQIIEHLPMHTFRHCVQRYRGNRKIKCVFRAKSVTNSGPWRTPH